MLAPLLVLLSLSSELSSLGDGFAELNFFGATLTNNNLGGFGPDEGPQNIRFRGVGQTLGGHSFDLGTPHRPQTRAPALK